MRKASTGMLERGTQKLSTVSDLIPAANEGQTLIRNSHHEGARVMEADIASGYASLMCGGQRYER